MGHRQRQEVCLVQLCLCNHIVSAAAQHVGQHLVSYAGQDAHDILTEACNDFPTTLYYSRRVSINDCKPWSRCHERAVRVLPHMLSCNTSQACFSRYTVRLRYKERVGVSSYQIGHVAFAFHNKAVLLSWPNQQALAY
jgi:hypothetical protein